MEQNFRLTRHPQAQTLYIQGHDDPLCLAPNLAVECAYLIACLGVLYASRLAPASFKPPVVRRTVYRVSPRPPTLA